MRSRRLKEERLLQRWEQIRAQGKARFVLHTTLTYGLAGAGLFDVLVNVLYGGTKYSLLSLGIVYLIIAMVTAHVSWWDMERKYKAALIDARVKASPSGVLPSHSNPSQITADSKSK